MDYLSGDYVMKMSDKLNNIMNEKYQELLIRELNNLSHHLPSVKNSIYLSHYHTGFSDCFEYMSKDYVEKSKVDKLINALNEIAEHEESFLRNSNEVDTYYLSLVRNAFLEFKK